MSYSYQHCRINIHERGTQDELTYATLHDTYLISLLFLHDVVGDSSPCWCQQAPTMMKRFDMNEPKTARMEEPKPIQSSPMPRCAMKMVLDT